MIDLPVVLAALRQKQVEFIVIGGIAAIAHGSAAFTQDLDLVYRRSPENLRRLEAALAAFKPYLRGAVEGLPFQLDYETLRRGLNFTLTSTAGDIDLLGEATGGGTYEALEPHSTEVEALEVRFRCVSLEKLIALKRAAGRPKDLQALAELEALLEEQQRRG